MRRDSERHLESAFSRSHPLSVATPALAQALAETLPNQNRGRASRTIHPAMDLSVDLRSPSPATPRVGTSPHPQTRPCLRPLCQERGPHPEREQPGAELPRIAILNWACWRSTLPRSRMPLTKSNVRSANRRRRCCLNRKSASSLTLLLRVRRIKAPGPGCLAFRLRARWCRGLEAWM